MRYALFKEIKTQQGTTIKYYIADDGTAKLDGYFKDNYLGSEQLYIGRGMYLSSKDIKIYHCSEKLHRLIYEKFCGKIPIGYHIHHLDYNHFNNNVNNLLCCSAFDHGCMHWLTGKFNNGMIPSNLDSNKYVEYNKWLNALYYKEKIENMHYTKEDAQKDIIKIFNVFDIKAQELREQLLEKRKKEQQQKRQEKQQQREKEIKDKLASGNYYINANGHLIPKEKTKWTPELRERIMKTRREKVYDNPEWRERVSNGIKQKYIEDETYKQKIIDSLHKYHSKN